MRRPFALGLVACALAGGAVSVAHALASAGQRPVVVRRFLLGHVDRSGRFIAVAGRNSTNVPRNAIAMFVFSGAIDQGPNTRATLPLTLNEQAELDAKRKADPDYDPTRDGYEPGVIDRKRSEDPAAFYVATGSVTPFSVIIGANQDLAEGNYFKYLRPRTGRPVPNRLLFNPRYTVATFNQPGEIDYHPEALLGNTDYLVSLDGGPTAANPFEVVRNLDGDPLAQPFSATFRTTSRYVQDYTRPVVRSRSPDDGSQNVEYDADIDIEFDEPMDVSSFVLPQYQGDDQWTINVRYAQTPKNGTLAGRNIRGTIRIRPQTAGNVIQFRPLQGFGKGPFDIEVVVTNGVTDLSGNNIVRQFQYTFTTESNPDAENFSELTEDFNQTTKRDGTFLPGPDYLAADWNASSARGLLTTTVQELNQDAQGLNPNNSVNMWYHQAIQVQMLFPPNTMGGRARAISGAWWYTGPANAGNGYLGRTYPNFSLQLGHANSNVDLSGFTAIGATATNYGDFPVSVVPSTTYRTTSALKNGTLPNNAYVKLPDFLTTYNYNGQNGLIMEIFNNGDPISVNNWERWRVDANYAINCSAINIPGIGSQTNNWIYSTRFTYLTPGAEAQSTFYDVGLTNARLLPQQIVPTTQPSGTSVFFQWQGAREDAINPSIPDMTTLTGWVSDIRLLAGYRYIRFRATLFNNTTSRTSPAVDILSIPYVWK